MSSDNSRRKSVWAPLYYAIVLVAGILIGFYLNNLLANKRSFSAIIHNNDPLEEIIELISDQYVDSINRDSLYADAVNGILKHLDPHTSYIPARDLQSVNEDLEGKFKGIGVEFFILKDTIQITSVVVGGPSEKAGLQPGDKLIKVNDSVVAGVAITSEQITAKLRGMEDSQVKLDILRIGKDQLLPIQVKRGIIPLYSVDAAYLMEDKITGYVRINRFSAQTPEEFKAALKSLQAQGMQQLILDLRQNPGGYLEAASYLADELLDDGKLIVYTEGLHSPREEYKAERTGLFEKGKIAVLIDEGSASASEIVAGAIQDWDRGVVIGRRSFGKGLVQEQFNLSDGSALRLTIARYYTPAGRSIQRNYANGKEAYEQDYIARFTDGSLLTADTAHPDTARFQTKIARRSIFGGGGVVPDIITPYDANYFSAALGQLLNNDIFNTFVYDYYAANAAKIRSYKTIDAFIQEFEVSTEMMNELHKKYILHNALLTRAVWANANDLAYLKTRMKALLARMHFHNQGYYQVLNKSDQVILKALETLQSDSYDQIIKGLPSDTTTPKKPIKSSI
jgi:carboxyl-terminal processing protease